MRNLIMSALVAALVAAASAQAGTLYASRTALHRVEAKVATLQTRSRAQGARLSALTGSVATLEAQAYSTQQVINCLAGAAYYRLSPTSPLASCVLIADVRGGHDH